LYLEKELKRYTLLSKSAQHTARGPLAAFFAAREFFQLQKMLQNSDFKQLIVVPEFLPNCNEIDFTARSKFMLINLAHRAFEFYRSALNHAAR